MMWVQPWWQTALDLALVAAFAWLFLLPFGRFLVKKTKEWGR